MICPVVTRFAAAVFAVCASSGMLMAQFSMSASPSALSFNYSPSQTTPIDLSTTVTAQVTGSVSATLSENLVGFMTVTPPTPQVGVGGALVTVRLVNPSQVTTQRSGELRLTPFSAGLNTLVIPITLYPNGSGGVTGLTATPNPVNISYTPGSTTTVQQVVTLSSSVSGQLSASLSSPLSSYVYVQPNPVTSPSTFTLFLNPQFAPASVSTTGFLTLTPVTSSGLPSMTIQVTISPFGSSTSNIVATPNPINFNSSVLSQFVQLTAPMTTPLQTSVSSSLGGWIGVPTNVSSNGSFNISLLNLQAFPNGATGSITLTPIATGTGLNPLTIPINVSQGTTGALSASPSVINFSYATGTTGQLSQTLTTSSPTSVLLTSSVSGSISGYISVPSTVSSNQSFQVTLLNPAAFTAAASGTLTLTPPVGSGLNTLNVAINVTPGGSTGSGLSTSPSSLNFVFAPGTSAAQTQTLLISAPVPTSVSITPSASIANYFQYPPSASSGQQIAIVLPYPQSVPSGTSGFFTLTPLGSGLAPINVPVSINATGGGTNALVVTPPSLVFNVQLGGGAPASQTVTLTNPNNITDFVTTQVASTNGFLSVGQSSSTTPLTLTANVNPSVFSQVGTYEGTITVLRLSTTTVLATIPVTVNVTQAVRVTPNPSAVTLNGVVGGAASNQTVQVNGDSTAAFTAAASTTSGGNWLSVAPASANLGASVTVTANPAGLAAGTYSGAITIQVQGAVAATIPVTYTVASPSSIQLSTNSLTFNYQTTSTNPPVAQPVQVNSSASGVTLNWTATPTSTGGWLQVSSGSGTTPGSFNVNINPAGLSAGTYTGSVSVASAGATNSPQTVSVTLVVTSPALPLVTSVVSAASLAPTVTTPGAILTLRGTNLGPADGVSGNVVNGMLLTRLGGVTVTFDGVAAPLLYVSATQINLVAPYEIANRLSTRVVITADGQASREIELRVGDTAPALFTANGSGSGLAAALNQNGSFNTAATPEAKGNIIVLYGTGEGVVTPSGVTGEVVDAASLRKPVAPVTVRIAGQLAEVTYAGSMPFAISGAIQINVRIPTNVPSGLLPVDIQIGAASNQSAVTIAVQ